MSSIDDILAQAENPAYVRVATAKVLLRQDLIALHEQLDDELRDALQADQRENRLPEAPRLAVAIEDLEAEIEAAKVGFRFRSIGKKAWADLLRAHPPTKDQKRADARAEFNPETFPVAAIAASCVEPELSLDAAVRLERALNDTQFNLLWAKCVDANTGGYDSPKSLAASGLNRLQKSLSASSATAADEPSPAASSSVG